MQKSSYNKNKKCVAELVAGDIFTFSLKEDTCEHDNDCDMFLVLRRGIEEHRKNINDDDVMTFVVDVLNITNSPDGYHENCSHVTFISVNSNVCLVYDAASDQILPCAGA